MGRYLYQVKQRLLAVLTAPFRAFLWLFGPESWWATTRSGRLFFRFWRFVGRLGAALRKLLTWFIWEPLLLVSPPFLEFWRLLGRMGLACRHLFVFLIWDPFLLVSSPFRWLFNKTIGRIWRWVWGKIRLYTGKRWQALAPRRAIYRRRLSSRWLLFCARWRVFLKRPKPPETAVVAPHLPLPPNIKLMRATAALGGMAIVLIVGFATMKEPSPEVTGSQVGLIPRIILTPTPAPPTPTPEPTSALPIELTPWPTPDPLNEGGSVAFTLHENGNSDIYVLSVGQSDPIRLTSHPAVDRDPAWSPNGRELAFASHRDGNWEIYVYNLPSGQLRRITNHLGFDGRPSWSPDGQWLIYESYQDENLDIFIIKADSTQGPFQLTQNPAPDYAPVWSPGGRHIAFTSWRGGNKDIFIMSLDQVSDETAVNITASPDLQEDNPAFSPDGRYLAYHEDSTGFDLIYASPLTNDARASGVPVNLGQQGRDPAWSPNSQSLFYVHHQNDKSFLIAGSPDAWGIAPQTYVANGRIEAPHWSAVTLPPDIAQNLRNIDQNGKYQPLYREALAPPEEDGPPVLLWELPVNAPSPYLNDRVDQSFLALRERVIEETGWDFLGQLDGMFVPIDSQPLPGLPSQSWNQAGRAFDFDAQEALAFEPLIEIVRQDRGAETYWRIYIRTENQDGSRGEPLYQLPWDFRARYGDEPLYFDQGGKWKEAIPSGYYIDFTALAADYGWHWVPSTSNWRTYFPGVRFWHYENRQGLSWEEAMLEIYTDAELIEVWGESENDA